MSAEINQNYVFADPDIEEFRDYEEILKLICYYKTGKIDREFFKERLFIIGFRKMSDEILDQIVDEAQLITDNAIDLIGIITFIKRLIEAGTDEKFLSYSDGPNIGIFRTFGHQYKPFFFEARPFDEAEVNTYAIQINNLLVGDKFCGPRLPIQQNGTDLYNKIRDGVILAKLFCILQPGIINLNVIHTNLDMNVFEKYDNLILILNAAKSIGINVGTIADDILDGNKEMINDLLGYILSRIHVSREDILINPETALLCQPGETVEDVANLPLNEFLNRWIEHKLKEKGLPSDFLKLEKLKEIGECKLLLEDLFPGINADDIVSTLNPDVVKNPNEAINTLLLGDIYKADVQRAGGVYDKPLMNAYVQKINDLIPNANLPMPENREFFNNLNNGIIMANLENLAEKNIIPKDDLNLGENLSKEEEKANLKHVIKAGKKLGLPTLLKPINLNQYRNIKYEQMIGDMLEKLLIKKELILKNPETPLLVLPGETIEDVANLPVEQFLLRWVNKHLSDFGRPPINNFGKDLQDGKVLGYLYNGIAPDYLDKIPIDLNSPVDIANIIGHMERMGVETHINPNDIMNGKERAGKLLLCEVYNNFANPYNVNEKECYSRIINHILDEDEDLQNQLPINEISSDLFKKLQDGIILSKLINIASPETLDERVLFNSPKITDEEKAQNLNLVINSAKSLGCLAETTNEDILEENRAKDLELLHQILRQIVFKRIGVAEFPQILRFIQPHEEARDILRLGPDDILKRWVNYHLKEMGLKERLINFSTDLRDSKIYAYLLHKLNPEININFLEEPDLYKRAQYLINEIPNIGANVYVTDSDIVTGNINLNKFLLAELFLSNHGLGEPTKEEVIQAGQLTYDDDKEISREERSFRTWINSLKLEGVGKINNLYEECKNGILLLKVIDKIMPGIVKWEKVDLNPKNIFKIGVNCQEAIDASKRCGIKIVSIGNKDIQEGSKKHIVSLVWQLMREQTLRIIGEKNEDSLINWGNSLVTQKRRVKSLKENKLSDALYWIELLEAIRPNCIRWEYVATTIATKQDKEMNAKYALSVARALGAVIFVVWEDITEVRSKLLLTFLASLYDVSRKGGAQLPDLEN